MTDQVSLSIRVVLSSFHEVIIVLVNVCVLGVSYLVVRSVWYPFLVHGCSKPVATEDVRVTSTSADANKH